MLRTGLGLFLILSLGVCGCESDCKTVFGCDRSLVYKQETCDDGSQFPERTDVQDCSLLPTPSVCEESGAAAACKEVECCSGSETLADPVLIVSHIEVAPTSGNDLAPYSAELNAALNDALGGGLALLFQIKGLSAMPEGTQKTPVSVPVFIGKNLDTQYFDNFSGDTFGVEDTVVAYSQNEKSEWVAGDSLLKDALLASNTENVSLSYSVSGSTKEVFFAGLLGEANRLGFVELSLKAPVASLGEKKGVQVEAGSLTMKISCAAIDSGAVIFANLVSPYTEILNGLRTRCAGTGTDGDAESQTATTLTLGFVFDAVPAYLNP